MNDEIIEEWGTDTGISFVTSNGIKSMKPGKIYDRNLNEQPERSKREDSYYVCLEMTKAGTSFEKTHETFSKEEAKNWVNQMPHLRTYHEKIRDAVL